MKKSLILLIILLTLTGCAELATAIPIAIAYTAGAVDVAENLSGIAVTYKETKDKLKGAAPCSNLDTNSSPRP